MVSQLLGGIGLFLLGVFLLTDGLKTAAGDALRRILVRFTGRPAAAFVSGAEAGEAEDSVDGLRLKAEFSSD